MPRHQLIVLNRQVKQPQLTNCDLTRLVFLTRYPPDSQEHGLEGLCLAAHRANELPIRLAPRNTAERSVVRLRAPDTSSLRTP
jgi:hypothetical protein